MITTKLQECFALFYGKDELRPKFDNPLTWNNNVFATDAYTLIYTDKENIDFEFENEHESPTNLDSIIPVANISETLIIPNLEPLKTAKELAPVGEDIKCSECDGDGEVEWEYGRWTKDMECPKCEGDGFEYLAKMMPTGNNTFRNIKVKIKENYLDIFKFNKVLKVQEILGGDIELLFCEPDKSALLFKVGICNIIVMKLSSVQDYEEILEIQTK